MQFGKLSVPRPGSSDPAPFSQEPREGHMYPDECHTLYTALTKWTTTPHACWLGIWEGWGSFGYPRSMGFFRRKTRSGRVAGDGGGNVEVKRMETELLEVAERVRRSPRFNHPGRSYLLAKSPCAAISELTHYPLGVTPSLAWPDDRAWFVGCEIDFDSTLIATSEECAAALLSDDRLETVVVRPEDRLDIGGDVLNLPLGDTPR
jgi:hypothetical protein